MYKIELISSNCAVSLKRITKIRFGFISVKKENDEIVKRTETRPHERKTYLVVSMSRSRFIGHVTPCESSCRSLLQVTREIIH